MKHRVELNEEDITQAVKLYLRDYTGREISHIYFKVRQGDDDPEHFTLSAEAELGKPLAQGKD